MQGCMDIPKKQIILSKPSQRNQLKLDPLNVLKNKIPENAEKMLWNLLGHIYNGKYIYPCRTEMKSVFTHIGAGRIM